MRLFKFFSFPLIVFIIMSATTAQLEVMKESMTRLAIDQIKFQKTQRKVKINTVLLPVSNPMSRRAINLDCGVLNKVEDISALVAPDGVIFTVDAAQIPFIKSIPCICGYNVVHCTSAMRFYCSVFEEWE